MGRFLAMPRPRVYKTQAIVLRQRKLGEADKIVTLYTSHQGKVDAVAKGVRRTKSRLAGHLEPLTLGSYMLAEGRELDIVTQAETVDAFAGLRADLDRVSRGLYCAELVATTYQHMGLLPKRRPASWYDPGKFWSGDRIGLEPPFALGGEIAITQG